MCAAARDHHGLRGARHPSNTLTLVGVLINVAAACCPRRQPLPAGRRHHDRREHLRLHRRQGRAADEHGVAFGAFWDSTLDRFSDIALFLGLIYLYSTLRRTDYVMVAALAMMFSIMTSYARARAESLIEKCKVGFMERPERIVLFMIGAFTNRMGAVLWVILILAIFTVADRIYYTYLVLNARTVPRGRSPITKVFTRAFFWTDERARSPTI
jgi:CDP-diacylglycerol--glycerol-3-phosphate 3-phosphatidyltransferase